MLTIAQSDLHRIAIAKLDVVEAGGIAVFCDELLDSIVDEDRVSGLVTIPNPNRVGILDQYLGWDPDTCELSKSRCRRCGDPNDTKDDIWEGFPLCPSCTAIVRGKLLTVDLEV